MRPIKLTTVLPVALNQIRQGSTFLSVKNYLDNFGGQSNFGIVFHADYLKAVKKAMNTWYAYTPSGNLEKSMRADLLDSYAKTLAGRDSPDYYRPITDGQHLVKSVKWHDAGSCVHLWGFLVHKKELVSPSYPAHLSAQKTIVRRRLMRLTSLWRFRQFKLTDGRFDSVGVENLTFTQRDLITNFKV